MIHCTSDRLYGTSGTNKNNYGICRRGVFKSKSDKAEINVRVSGPGISRRQRVFVWWYHQADQNVMVRTLI